MLTFRYRASMPGAVRHRHAALPAYKRLRRGTVKSSACPAGAVKDVRVSRLEPAHTHILGWEMVPGCRFSGTFAPSVTRVTIAAGAEGTGLRVRVARGRTLSRGEGELVAAYVSRGNECEY
jgi:hypothetical protein